MALKTTQDPRKLRKIGISDLRPGMFVHELCGSWMDHPFWKSRFLLEDPADLAALQGSAIRELWIDTSRGLDVDREQAPAAVETESPSQREERLERELIETLVAEQAAPARVELQAEVKRAAAICAKAKTQVTAMFAEARMGKAVAVAQLDPLVDEISSSVLRNPGALISLARLKTQDDYTYLHSVAVCALMVALGRQLGLDPAQCREVGLAGLVHDIGKAAIPLAILNKPGKLTDDEFVRMKSHPVAGHEMLVEGGGVGDVPLDVCLHHHEKVDGSGYPDRLDDQAISLFAKMGAVCDVYDAITSDRPYKAGWDPATSIRRMNEWSKGHFDQRVFQAFVKTVGIYPVGTLVRLESGLLAVVTEVNETALLTPTVKAFYCTRRKSRIAPQLIDLGQSRGTQRIKGWENPEEWRFPDLTELWSGQPTPHRTSGAA